MSDKLKYLFLGVLIALSALFLMEKAGVELAAPVTANEGPRCKIVLGLSQGEGIAQFEKSVEERLAKGYKVVGFSSLPHEEVGFYLQAVMTRD